MKVTVCVCLCREISQTAKPIGFSFAMKLLIGPGNVYNYFEEGSATLTREFAKKLKNISAA